MESDIIEMFVNNDQFNSNLQETLISIVKANDVARQEMEELKDSYSKLKKVIISLMISVRLLVHLKIGNAYAITYVFTFNFEFLQAHEQLQVNAKRENDIRKREIKNLKEKLAKHSDVSDKSCFVFEYIDR